MRNEPIHTETHGALVIKIFQDIDASNPRTDFEHLGTIYHTHRNYDLGERMDLEEIQAIMQNPDFISVPVFMYEHGNVMLKTSGFSCQWDSGQVGIIAVEKSKVLKDWQRKKFSKKLEAQVISCLTSEVQEFSDYLSGNVYGYVIEKPTHCESCSHNDAEHVDSCWGFIGDYEYCLKEAISNLPKAA
jgi:hypothetical protein